MMTIRQCVRKILDNDLPTQRIITNNGTLIQLNELFSRGFNFRNDYGIGTIKFKEDGSIDRIKRYFCTIYKSPNTNYGDYKNPKKEWLYDTKADYNYFTENDFLFSEREMNHFISLNYGIDEYQTIDIQIIMRDDLFRMMNDLEDEMNGIH